MTGTLEEAFNSRPHLNVEAEIQLIWRELDRMNTSMRVDRSRSRGEIAGVWSELTPLATGQE